MTPGRGRRQARRTATVLLAALALSSCAIRHLHEPALEEPAGTSYPQDLLDCQDNARPSMAWGFLALAGIVGATMERNSLIDRCMAEKGYKVKS